MAENQPMIFLRLKRNPIRHRADVRRLSSILEQRGYAVSEEDIQDAYSQWSEANFGASWQAVSASSEDESDDEIFNGMMEYLEAL